MDLLFSAEAIASRPPFQFPEMRSGKLTLAARPIELATTLDLSPGIEQRELLRFWTWPTGPNPRAECDAGGVHELHQERRNGEPSLAIPAANASSIGSAGMPAAMRYCTGSPFVDSRSRVR